MARWGKNIVVPLESLIKEKENTNRPTAARSAGTVGKWGKMGFTSTRTYALKAISATITATGNSPEGEDVQQPQQQQQQTNALPKPKKFFKSRNTSSIDIMHTQIFNLPRELPVSPEGRKTTTTTDKSPQKKEPPLKIKIPKPSVERKKSTSSEHGVHQHQHPKNEKKKKEKKLKPEAPPSRIISRQRKVVNYAEDDDERSQTPLRDILVPKFIPKTEVEEEEDCVNLEAQIEPEEENATTKTKLDKVQQKCVVEPSEPIAGPPITPAAVHKTPNSEHPPIVLRISKGTSRLISTDSEDIINSPTYEPSTTTITTAAAAAVASATTPTIIDENVNKCFNDLPPLKCTRSTEKLIEEKAEKDTKVQEEDNHIENDQLSQTSINVQERNEIINNSEKILNEPPKHESLKIVIKADVLKTATLLEKSERKVKNKKHHKMVHKIASNEFKTPSPPPAAAISNDYDLLRNLVTSPSERDFDSQSSILGSVSSKDTTNQFSAVINDENCVIRSRGSSDVTSELESSQHSSLVAPPSDIESRLESMMEGEDEEPIVGIHETNSQGKTSILLPIEEGPLKEDILEVLTGEKLGSEKEQEDFLVSQSSQPSRNSSILEATLEPQLEIQPAPETAVILDLKQVEINEDKIEAEKEEKEVVFVKEPSRRITRSRKSAAKIEVSEPALSEVSPPKNARVTRNNNNGVLKNKTPATTPIRSYTRKRKNNTSTITGENLETNFEILKNERPSINLNLQNDVEKTSFDYPEISEEVDAAATSMNKSSKIDKLNNIINEQGLSASDNNEKEYKATNKFKRTWYERSTRINEDEDHQQVQEPLTKKSCSDNENNLSVMNKPNKFLNNNPESAEPMIDIQQVNNEDVEKPSVKLVISKKKGSIFKSRALITDQGDQSKKRHVYKHTWDGNEDKKEQTEETNENPSTNSVSETLFQDFSEFESTSKLTRLTRQATAGKVENETVTSVKCDKNAKDYYTVVRNVKTAHQIQEIGEYQEMDDDVEYILDALQSHNPIPTRCLSALQLASKCMTPAFRMHVRAHGTVTKFFKALRDAKSDLSLGLCTATIMFVLSQDTLNMDLDRDSLQLMMNLLEVDVSNILDEGGLANFERNKLKVKELCEEIKSQGKAAHLNIETITVGTLAMETLLSLTSKRAGEWFKEELRELGGLEHIIKTICECCHQISDYVVSWTEVLLDKLRTIERCLRVLENVSQQNEKNQDYILSYNNGSAVNTLFKLYKLCDSEIALYPTSDNTPKENPGVVLREALVPTLKVLINLTHPFDNLAVGSAILGQREGIFDTSFHILLQAPNYVPERCIFELSILVLLLLINLTMHTIPNRALIMRSHAPSDFGNQFDKVPAIKALIEYFYRCEEQACLAEQNTNDILEPDAANKKPQSQEEVDETVTKLLQKAGHHMEHTLQASYASILIGHLISENEENERIIRTYLKESSFKDMINILEKYYNFMNLTASSEASVVSHIKSTKKLIDYFKNCDEHSNIISKTDEIGQQQGTSSSSSSSSISTRSTTHRVYKTYSQR